MALTNQKLDSLLQKIGSSFAYDADQEWYCGTFTTRIFKNDSNAHQLTLVIKLVEDGGFIRFLCPELYDLKNCKDRGAVFESAMQMGWMTKALAYEYDAGNKKMWAVIETPLQDGTLTSAQLERIILLMIRLVDEYDPVIRHAIAFGEIDFTKAGKKLKEQSEPTEVEALIAKIGGVEKLKELASGKSAT